MKLRWLCIILPFFVSCSYHVVRCDYIFLPLQAGLAPTAEASSNGECHFDGGKAPTEYVLSRDGYSISFSIGDRWYPQIMIDVQDKNGRPLSIESIHVRESHHGDAPAPIVVRGRSYRYFARPEEVPEQVLVFRVIDAAGATLGVERVPFELRKGRHTAIDAL